MKNKFSESRAKEQKEAKAEKAEEQAVVYRAVDCSGNGALLVQGLCLGNSMTAMEPVRAVGNKIKGSDIPVRIPYSLRADAVSRPNRRSLSGMAIASMLCRRFWMTRPADSGTAIMKSSGKRARMEKAGNLSGRESLKRAGFSVFLQDRA